MTAVLINFLILLIVVGVLLGVIQIAVRAGIMTAWMAQIANLIIGAIFLIGLIYLLLPLLHGQFVP